MTAAKSIFLILACGVAHVSAFDLQGFVDREIQAGNHDIVIPPGRYRVTPRDRQHLVLRGLKNVGITATGVEMICTETTRALTISGCENLTLRGLCIDYDPLPFTQGKITSLSADKRVQDIELSAGYPAAETARNFKYEIFRPDTRTLRCGDRGLEKIEVVDSRHLRVTRDSGRPEDEEQVGDLIVIGSETGPHGSIAHAVECSRNENVKLQDIDLFASNCFGFLETDCDASTYERCRIDRRPAGTEIAERADPRLRSLDADAFHSKRAMHGPSYISCTARYMADDCVNICGDYHMIMSSDKTKLRVLAKHDMDSRPGDPVELVSYTGARLPDATAVSVEAAGEILAGERSFLSRQRMDAGLKQAKGALEKAYIIILDRPVELPAGSVICSANRVGNGFTVKNCNFGFNRSRGILIKASHGEISGNLIESSRMSAILVSPEYWWLEAGSSSDLTITGNTIRDCGGVAIQVIATGGNGEIAPAGAHRDIAIARNSITGSAMPGILVSSTEGLAISNNHFDLKPAGIPDLMRRAGIAEPAPVVTILCAKSITRNDP